MRIETERLIITVFDSGMVEDVHKQSLDADTRRFLPDEVFETVQQAEKTIAVVMDCYTTGNSPQVYPVLKKICDISCSSFCVCCREARRQFYCLPRCEVRLCSG